MSIQFKTEKSLNVGGMKMIPIKTEDDKQLFVKQTSVFLSESKRTKNLKQFRCR